MIDLAMTLAQVRIKGMAVHVGCQHFTSAERILELMVFAHLTEVTSEALIAVTPLVAFVKNALIVAQEHV